MDGQLMVTNTYDVRNQLLRTVTDGTTVINTYNGEGLRVAKEVNGQKTQYLYEYDKIILEADGQNNVIARTGKIHGNTGIHGDGSSVLTNRDVAFKN